MKGQMSFNRCCMLLYTLRTPTVHFIGTWPLPPLYSRLQLIGAAQCFPSHQLDLATACAMCQKKKWLRNGKWLFSCPLSEPTSTCSERVWTMIAFLRRAVGTAVSNVDGTVVPRTSGELSIHLDPNIGLIEASKRTPFSC